MPRARLGAPAHPAAQRERAPLRDGRGKHTLHGPKARQGAGAELSRAPGMAARCLSSGAEASRKKRYSPAGQRRQRGELPRAEEGEEEKEEDEASVGRANTHLPRADRAAAPAQP